MFLSVFLYYFQVLDFNAFTRYRMFLSALQILLHWWRFLSVKRKHYFLSLVLSPHFIHYIFLASFPPSCITLPTFQFNYKFYISFLVVVFSIWCCSSCSANIRFIYACKSFSIFIIGFTYFPSKFIFHVYLF